MIAPLLERIASDYAGELIIAKINTDEHQEWAEKSGVQGIPTMLFFRDGMFVHAQVGALPEPQLREMVEEFLKSDEKVMVH
jgi:thioredoxin-like negative regulator of GroEL